MLFLVMDLSSERDAVLVLANNEEHAAECARKMLGLTPGEPERLQVICEHNASEPSRSKLSFWGRVAEEALRRGHSPKNVEQELNGITVLSHIAPRIAERMVVDAEVELKMELNKIRNDILAQAARKARWLEMPAAHAAREGNGAWRATLKIGE